MPVFHVSFGNYGNHYFLVQFAVLFQIFY